MTELRFDLTANEWVIIAHERAKRPYDFVKNEEIENSQIFVEDCPFCAGNERLTPPEVTSYRKSSENSWSVRIVPNMFPALSPISIREEKVVVKDDPKLKNVRTKLKNNSEHFTAENSFGEAAKELNISKGELLLAAKIKSYELSRITN